MATRTNPGITKSILNPNCDGAGPDAPYGVCKGGEVRRVPIGGDGAVILCRRCFRAEIVWRKERNKELGEYAQFDLPKWEDLEVYEVT